MASTLLPPFAWTRKGDQVSSDLGLIRKDLARIATCIEEDLKYYEGISERVRALPALPSIEEIRARRQEKSIGLWKSLVMAQRREKGRNLKLLWNSMTMWRYPRVLYEDPLPDFSSIFELSVEDKQKIEFLALHNIADCIFDEVFESVVSGESNNYCLTSSPDENEEDVR